MGNVYFWYALHLEKQVRWGPRKQDPLFTNALPVWISLRSSFAECGLLWQQRKSELKAWNMRCYAMPLPVCENEAKAKNRSQSFSMPSRWATWSLGGLGAKIKKNKNTVTAEHLCGEPQPMQWNGITDGGHWGEGCSTSEARDFNWIQRASFRTCLSWLNWPFPFPKAAWVLKLIGCENKSDEVSEEPPPVFLGRIYSLVPLFARYVDRIVVQQLLASLEKENIFSLPTEPASQKPNDLHFKGKHAF